MGKKPELCLNYNSSGFFANDKAKGIGGVYCCDSSSMGLTLIVKAEPLSLQSNGKSQGCLKDPARTGKKMAFEMDLTEKLECFN